jgi:hypothetical protein
LVPLRDTTPEAKAVQIAAYRRQTPGQRLQRAIELSDFTHQLALAGLKMRHPACSDDEANRLLAEVLYQRRNNAT